MRISHEAIYQALYIQVGFWMWLTSFAVLVLVALDVLRKWRQGHRDLEARSAHPRYR